MPITRATRGCPPPLSLCCTATPAIRCLQNPPKLGPSVLGHNVVAPFTVRAKISLATKLWAPPPPTDERVLYPQFRFRVLHTFFDSNSTLVAKVRYHQPWHKANLPNSAIERKLEWFSISMHETPRVERTANRGTGLKCEFGRTWKLRISNCCAPIQHGEHAPFRGYCPSRSIDIVCDDQELNAGGDRVPHHMFY